MDPRPDIKERLLWGTEREGKQPVANPPSKLTWRVLGLVNFGIYAYVLYALWNDGALDRLGAPTLQGLGFFLLILIPVVLTVIVIKFIAKWEHLAKTPHAIPLWLGQTRLAYVPADAVFGKVVDVTDMNSAGLDYVEGSLAVRVKTASETLDLFSSDAEQLLHHLYTLRPDLEPTS